VHLTLTAGAILDIDPEVDLAGTKAFITLSDATSQDFGDSANPISSSIGNILSIDTAAGKGNQFITQTKSLLGIDLNAGIGGIGNATLVAAGRITDNDPSPDIIASTASISIARGDFGVLSHPIGTSVQRLSVNTAAENGN